MPLTPVLNFAPGRMMASAVPLGLMPVPLTRPVLCNGPLPARVPEPLVVMLGIRGASGLFERGVTFNVAPPIFGPVAGRVVAVVPDGTLVRGGFVMALAAFPLPGCTGVICRPLVSAGLLDPRNGLATPLPDALDVCAAKLAPIDAAVAMSATNRNIVVEAFHGPA